MRYKARANREILRSCTSPASWFTAEILTIALPFSILQDDAAVELSASLLGDEGIWFR